MNSIAERSLKKIRKKARLGFRGWPVATIAFYGPDLSRASKVAVGIVPYDGADAEEMRSWFSHEGDVRRDPLIFNDIVEFVESHSPKSVVMTGRVIGCPHQEDIDYEGEWCPACDFWKGRDRFTGELAS